MVKGVSVKFKSYSETIPQLLKVIKLDEELKKHNKIVIKPSLKNMSSVHSSSALVEQVLRYCISNKAPDAEIFIAEGSDGNDTDELFNEKELKKLAEQYSIGLIDLNNTETGEVIDDNFLKFESIQYPKILKESFVISLSPLVEDAETEIQSSLSNMLGAFPAAHYSGFFSSKKNKIRKWPIKYSIHDILVCKMPNLAIIDASEKGIVLAGQPLEMDKQAAKLLGKDWRAIQHLRLVDESSFSKPKKIEPEFKTESIAGLKK